MKKDDLITYINQIIAQYKDQTTVLFEKEADKERRASDNEAGKPGRKTDAKLQQARVERPRFVRRQRIHTHGSRADRPPGISDGADEKFCDVIVHRWEEFTGKKAVRAGNLEVSL